MFKSVEGSRFLKIILSIVTPYWLCSLRTLIKASGLWHIHRSVRSSPLQLNLEISSPQRDPAALNITTSSSLILPQPLTNFSSYFQSLQICLFWTFPTNAVIRHVVFCGWCNVFLNLGCRGSSSRHVQYHRQEDAGTHQKKDAPRPRTKGKPQ